MGFITLDDRSGRIEASLFADAFASNQALLQSDALVVVEGEVSNDDFSGGLRLRAKRVMSLEEARTGLAESLRLKEIGRAHVRTPVTNAQLVCRLLLEKK